MTDNGNHRVMKFTNDGELLVTLGIKGQAGATDDTFGRPADIAFGPNDGTETGWRPRKRRRPSGR